MIETAFNSEWFTSFVLIEHILDQKLLKKANTSITEYRALAVLRFIGKPISTKSLSDIISLVPSTASRCLQRLNSTGACTLVEEENVSDRRVSLYTISRQGKVQFELANEVVKKTIAGIWEPVLNEKLDEVIRQSIIAVKKRGLPLEETGKVHGEVAYVFSVCDRKSSFSRVAQRFGLPLPEYRILFRLAESNEATAPVQLASDLFMWPNDVSLRCEALNKRGYVSRSRNPRNSRNVKVELLDDGFEIVEKVTQSMQEALATIPGVIEFIPTVTYLAEQIVSRMYGYGDMNNILRQI